MSRQLALLADYLEREVQDHNYTHEHWAVPYGRKRCAVGHACAMGIPDLKLDGKKKEPVFKTEDGQELRGHKAGAAALGCSLEILLHITDPTTRLGVVQAIRNYLFALEW